MSGVGQGNIRYLWSLSPSCAILTKLFPNVISLSVSFPCHTGLPFPEQQPVLAVHIMRFSSLYKGLVTDSLHLKYNLSQYLCLWLLRKVLIIVQFM